jgi:hypothetical protein
VQALGAAGVSAADPFAFGDEMRVGLRGTSRRVWGQRGVQVIQPIQLVYEWRYLFLTVDGRAGRLHWCWIDRLDADSVVGAVGGLAHTDELTALIWDGAPAHRDSRIAELGLPTISLPAYSPELNPAERLFQELRRAVEGRVYANLEDKVAAVETELADWDADPARVRSLCGWAWIEAAVPHRSEHAA